MAKFSNKRRSIVKDIANTRILYLFQRAHEIFPSNQILANRYVYLARRYAQRAKVDIPIIWKKRICKKCKKFLYPGKNYRVRLHSRGKGSHISVTCLECNKSTRYFIKLKK